MSARDRVLAYLTGLVAVFALAFVVGQLVGPVGGTPDRAPSHAPTMDHR